MATNVQFVYKPFPTMVGYHMTTAREKAAFGGVGSGKTIALCADAILLGLQQPGSKILIARLTVPSLRDTTEGEFINLLSTVPEEDEDDDDVTSLYDICEVRKGGGHVTDIFLPNGTHYLFRSLDDWRRLMGLNLAGVYIDEASEITHETYIALGTRLRQKRPLPAARRQGHKTITRHVQAICANPNGQDWMWEHFIKETEERPELRSKRRYFRSTSFDNPTLYNEDGTPDEFLQSLMRMPPLWVARMVECSFDAFAGQIYPWDPERHVYTHFDPPADWERAMGLDWGLRNPTAIVWWARHPDTQVWHQYREWQSYDPTNASERDTAITPTVHSIAATIKRLEGTERIRWRAIDPACANRQADSGKSIMYWFSHYGLHFQKGLKEYEPRINALTQLLDLGQLTVSDDCPMTAISLQQYRWEDLKPGATKDGPERPQKVNDHLPNAAEYLATIFASPTITPPPPKVHTFNSEVWSKVRKQVARRSSRSVV